MKEKVNAVCILLCVGTMMPLPSHRRSASVKTRRGLIVCPPNTLAKIEIHNGSVRPISVSHGSIKSPAMKAVRRAGGFADC